MRKLSKYSIGLLVLLTSHLNSTAIGIKEAILQKQISIEMKGISGKNIQLSMNNLSGKTQQIELSAGQFLMPDDPEIQRMMVAKDTNILLLTTKTAILQVKSFCTQNRKSGLRNTTIFTLGNMAEGNLLKLAKLISKNNYYSDAAQQAVWCLTDKADLYGIVGGNESETKVLREFVHKITGQPLTMKVSQVENEPDFAEEIPERKKVNTIEHVIKDTIRFSNREKCSTTLTISDTSGKEILVFFKDRPLGENANATYSYSFTYKYMEVGKYFIRLRKNNGELIYEKEMMVKED